MLNSSAPVHAGSLRGNIFLVHAVRRAAQLRTIKASTTFVLDDNRWVEN